MIAVGSQAPDFELTDDSGKAITLSQFLGQKVILYFYPKALTKG
jgi:peroxiredoxin Q/BCP